MYWFVETKETTHRGKPGAALGEVTWEGRKVERVVLGMVQGTMIVLGGHCRKAGGGSVTGAP